MSTQYPVPGARLRPADVESARWRRFREWCEAVIREARVPSAEAREGSEGEKAS